MRKTRKYPYMFGSSRRTKRIKEDWRKTASANCSLCVSEPICFDALIP